VFKYLLMLDDGQPRRPQWHQPIGQIHLD